MGSALVYVIVVGLVAAAVYLVAAFVFGRGEELAPMPPGATPTRLPARDLTGGDVRDLRFQQALRGYKCSEVDWALERLAAEVDALRARVEAMEGAQGADSADLADPAPATHNGHAAQLADPTPTDPTVHAGGERARDAGGSGASSGALRGMTGVDGLRR
jgi:DivIVA domain-containing protein